MAPLELRHRSLRPISAKHAQASRFLQQRRSEHPARVAQDAQLQREATTSVGPTALAHMPDIPIAEDRQRLAKGKRCSVSVDLGGRGKLEKKKKERRGRLIRKK